MFIISAILLAISILPSPSNSTYHSSNDYYQQKDLKNLTPVIGILTQPDTSVTPQQNSILYRYYQLQLQVFGAQIVPVIYNMEQSKLINLLDQLNGVLFTGGSLDLCDRYNNYNTYTKTSQIIWNYAKEKNDQGVYYPLWGTCQGFQLFHILAADNCDALGFSKGIDFPSTILLQQGAFESRLFRNFQKHNLLLAQVKDFTYNIHGLGVPYSYYKKYPKLNEFFDILTTTYDQDDIKCVSTIEAKRYPFYAVQYHPEKVQFNFDSAWKVPHDVNAILLSQDFSRFFVNQCRKNVNKFDKNSLQDKWLIENYPLYFKESRGHVCDAFITPNDL